jgi:hypothetical protein
MEFGSDSSTQRDAERLILDAVEKSLGVLLTPKRLTFRNGAVVRCLIASGVLASSRTRY